MILKADLRRAAVLAFALFFSACAMLVAAPGSAGDEPPDSHSQSANPQPNERESQAGNWREEYERTLNSILAEHPELRLPPAITDLNQVFAQLVELEWRAMECGKAIEGYSWPAQNGVERQYHNCMSTARSDICSASADAVTNATLFFDHYYDKRHPSAAPIPRAWQKHCHRKPENVEVADVQFRCAQTTSLLLFPVVYERTRNIYPAVGWSARAELASCAGAQRTMSDFGGRCSRMFREHGIGRRLSVGDPYTDVDWAVCRVFAKNDPDADMHGYGEFVDRPIHPNSPLIGK